ncbi:hypothetical protein [Magnetospirillum molischianum]|uniref:Uncharacterized protein n=1 Tax=Magnetospirillum molischianum DSM 120 TaxID=1150626 RepID=H8FYC9_MAGML|nr:hypothetical protein [Magnetospirillum molischianum]CCG43367.1 hypothetical protein PHAMO_80158 [Magnetospirillum molischianum DSM 120]
MKHDPELANELRELAKLKQQLGQEDEAVLLNRLAGMADTEPSISFHERIKSALCIGRNVPTYNRIVLGRNESLRGSLYLGWVLVPFWLPTSLLQIIAPPLIEILSASVAIVAGVFAWLMVQVMLLVAAPLGMVRRGNAGELADEDDFSAA